MTRYRPTYWGLDKNKVPFPHDDHNLFKRTIDELSARKVGNDTVGDTCISTVFLGLDYNWLPDQPPLVFETCLFRKSSSEVVERYSTWDDAVLGHKKYCEQVEKNLH